MAQLVGQPCVVCGERIGWVGDSRFCPDCRSPVHHACATAAPNAPRGGCRACGARPEAAREYPPTPPGTGAHWLDRCGDPSGRRWLLWWDAARLVVRDPAGRAVVDDPVARAHRAVAFFPLFERGTVGFDGPAGPLAFTTSARGVAALREFVADGLAADPGYRARLMRQAAGRVGLGLAAFAAAAAAFGLYGWFAAVTPNPPPGHWVRGFGWAIRGALSAVLAAAGAGAHVAFTGLRRCVLVSRVGRPTGGGSPGRPGDGDAAGRGRTTLLAAVGAGDAVAVEALLAGGADPNRTDAHGNGPLWDAVHRACLAGRTDGNLEVVRLLVVAGADPDHKNRYGRSPRDSAGQRDRFIAGLLAGLLKAPESRAAADRGPDRE